MHSTPGTVDHRADAEGNPTAGGYSVKGFTVRRGLHHIPSSWVRPAPCALSPAYSPLKHYNVGPGARVAILGLGGLRTRGRAGHRPWAQTCPVISPWTFQGSRPPLRC